MPVPRFFVVARVVGSAGSFSKWVERLVSLCEVSAAEPHGSSYYWGQDLDGEPDTLWGLEGYSHAVGFFMGHPASDVFKREMSLVDSDKLLKTVQGLGSPDYDLHHYDWYGGFLTREEDADKYAKNSHVAVHHFWAKEGKREELLGKLLGFAEGTQVKESVSVQSAAVLKEVNDMNLATLWIRTKTTDDFKSFQGTDAYKSLTEELKAGSQIVTETELHNSKAFNGSIDKKPKYIL
ncbi:hypothetical protein F5884DRAFT_146441 [Xylogone sp. PMI_703]|nr:hypothetical protein F5884DRAFT_146441 [Xylogone sp. PMI_703]